MSVGCTGLWRLWVLLQVLTNNASPLKGLRFIAQAHMYDLVLCDQSHLPLVHHLDFVIVSPQPAAYITYYSIMPTVHLEVMNVMFLHLTSM